MGTIITKSDKEVLHFFDEMKRVSDLIDHLPMDNRHLLDGENYLTDTELAGKLKLSKRTLLDYRSSGILPYYQIGGKILYRESDIVQLLEKLHRPYPLLHRRYSLHSSHGYGTRCFASLQKTKHNRCCRPLEIGRAHV